MLSLTVLAVLLQPAPAAIPAVEIRSDILCRTCRFVRDTVVILESDYAIIPQSVAIVGNDVFVIPFAGADVSVRRFDLATGRYRGVVFRSGGGPGEVRSPGYLGRMPGESLFVYDMGQQRFGIYGPRSYSYVRGATVSVSRTNAAIHHPITRETWIAAPVGSADQVGYPIHLFASDGRWVRSVGPSQPLLRRDGYMAFAKHLTIDSGGGVWAVTRYGTLAIEQYDRSGTLVRRLSYAPEWSPPLERLLPQRPGEPPFPERTPFAVQDGNRIWIATLVPARDWRRGLTTIDDPTHGAGAPVVDDVAKIFDSIVEVIDVERLAVEVRVRLDEAVMTLLPGGLAVLYRQTADGAPQLWIERWRVLGSPSAQRTPQ